jgi:hypothetical protein
MEFLVYVRISLKVQIKKEIKYGKQLYVFLFKSATCDHNYLGLKLVLNKCVLH